ncbi:AAA family ATPase [Endozoicomonas gorgoniicola]|uniref:endopeptidase La n=1 Tax=Endozoicomonas gorgoniicola TaxID=1234144 RepID=A0ABT3MY30_9GAMM|nr:ATP-binding protein [Endozoicomonas gorgoniicola]MCW7554274.1 AAA family ATPase [Endozoicomonas gorgoniicola]
MKKLKLSTNQLIAKQPVKELGFKSTDELENYVGILGQERATSAIQFGVAMHRTGYNIYVMGESGTGRMSYLRKYLETEAKRQSPPDDWAYINNFDNTREPKALQLPAGHGNKLQKDFDEFVDSLLLTFPAAFENPTYQQRKSLIEREFNRRYDQTIDVIEQEALKLDIALYREQGSLSFTPMQKGKAMDETEFAQLPDKKRTKFNNDIGELETMLNESLVELPQWKRESNEKLQKLNQNTIDQALEPLLKPLRKEYNNQKNVLEYFEAVKQHLHRSIIDLLADDRAMESKEDSTKRAALIELYAPNLVVAQEENGAAPVIYESHPSYKNLFGRIEYASEMGALVTNYRQICPGSLHQANGGYLLLDANKLLEEPFVWEALKRALKEQQLKIESPYAELGMLNTITLNPEVIPLNVKIILVGSRDIYYVLQQLDPDFHEMFRVLVDFDDRIVRDQDSVQAFSQLLKNRADDEGYPPLTASAVSRMVEQSSRMAEHQREMSAKIGDLFDLLAESDFIRRMGRGRKINHEHVDRAIAAKAERTGRVSKQILDEMLEGSILIDSEGEKVGKINGLTVLSIGDTSFGSPARITAAVYPGSQGVVDIEREVQLGQAIHSKGVMIISGYLGNKYAQKFPLAISASLAMEQSYGYIDGDSASLAELCCLISALTDTPIKQSFAVTGSMNQYGEVQAIGGANEKIEGFFDLCAARGLTGDQGVIIPAANVRNLMLHQKVVDAVRAKQFSVYAVNHAEEALELLTGCKPGSLNSKGEYTKGSLNFKVVNRLKEISELSKEGN